MEHSIKFEIYHVIQIEGTLMAICWRKLQALILLKNCESRLFPRNRLFFEVD